MIGTLLCFKYHHDYEWRQAKVYQNFSFLLFLIGSLDLKFKGKRSLLYQLVQLALSSTMSKHNTCSKTATEHLKEAVLCLTQTQTTLSSSQTDLAMRLALYSNNSMPLVPPPFFHLKHHHHPYFLHHTITVLTSSSKFHISATKMRWDGSSRSPSFFTIRTPRTRNALLSRPSTWMVQL